jgi:hypothetical protein
VLGRVGPPGSAAADEVNPVPDHGGPARGPCGGKARAPLPPVGGGIVGPDGIRRLPAGAVTPEHVDLPAMGSRRGVMHRRGEGRARAPAIPGEIVDEQLRRAVVVPDQVSLAARLGDADLSAFGRRIARARPDSNLLRGRRVKRERRGEDEDKDRETHQDRHAQLRSETRAPREAEWLFDCTTHRAREGGPGRQ